MWENYGENKIQSTCGARETSKMEQNKRSQKAKEKAGKLKSFYIHLLVYVLVNFFLFLINLLASPKEIWFYWPLAGWGIGLAGHAFFVFGFASVLDEDWGRKKIKKIMEKEPQGNEE